MRELLALVVMFAAVESGWIMVLELVKARREVARLHPNTRPWVINVAGLLTLVPMAITVAAAIYAAVRIGRGY